MICKCTSWGRGAGGSPRCGGAGLTRHLCFDPPMLLVGRGLPLDCWAATEKVQVGARLAVGVVVFISRRTDWSKPAEVDMPFDQLVNTDSGIFLRRVGLGAGVSWGKFVLCPTL